MPRSGLAVVAALLGSLTPALAGADTPLPPTPTTPAEMVELHERCKLEEAKTKSLEPSDLDGCAQRYVDYYRHNPTDPQLDQIFYNAGVMFEMVHSVSAATRTYALLRRYFPTSKLAAKALAREGKLYADIAMYGKAAALLEEYAKRYAGEKDAYDAMSDAVFYRTAIGDDDKAIENTRYFIKTFGAKKPGEAANAHFALTGIFEKRGDRESVIKHLREYIRTYGTKGGDDRLVIAYAKIGQSLWEQSCPVKAIDGACVRVERPTRATVAQCAPGTNVTFVRVKRDDKLVKEALVAFSSAVKQFERLGGRSDDAGARYYYASAKLADADNGLDGILDAAVPADLDATAPSAQRRLEDWFEFETKRRGELLRRYEQIFAIKDAATSITAASRIARVQESFADALATAAIPKSLRTGAKAAEQTKAHCDRLRTLAEPLRATAITSHGVCLAKATELSWFDDAARSCEAGLLRLVPEQYPPLRERSTRAAHVAPVLALEPPL